MLNFYVQIGLKKEGIKINVQNYSKNQFLSKECLSKEWVSELRFKFSFFFKKWSFSGLFCVFSSFSHYNFNNTYWKSLDGVLGFWTRGHSMVGADDAKELWRPPKNFPFTSSSSSRNNGFLSNGTFTKQTPYFRQQSSTKLCL